MGIGSGRIVGIGCRRCRYCGEGRGMCREYKRMGFKAKSSGVGWYQGGCIAGGRVGIRL